MKKIIIILVISFLSCSKDNAESSVQFTPVDSTHLIWGKWNAYKIEDSDGNALYSECDISNLFIDFKYDADATWRRVRINNNGCASSNYNYYDWAYAGDVGFVNIFTQGTGGYSYRVCKADLYGENKLRLAIVTIRKGGTGELIKSIPRDEREYYFFNKDNN